MSFSSIFKKITNFSIFLLIKISNFQYNKSFKQFLKWSKTVLNSLKIAINLAFYSEKVQFLVNKKRHLTSFCTQNIRISTYFFFSFSSLQRSEYRKKFISGQQQRFSHFSPVWKREEEGGRENWISSSYCLFSLTSCFCNVLTWPSLSQNDLKWP